MAFMAHETLPKGPHASQPAVERFGGYGRVLADRPFLGFIVAMIFTQMSAAVMWILLSVYTKVNFGLPENMYGFIPMTNALMVVVMQIPITALSKRGKPLHMLALGGLLYGLGVGSVALGRGFWAFWASMVVMTLGELVLMPTSSTYAANLAPADMRGRYMSLYGLTWNVAQGIGPLVGGLMNDTLGPLAIWYTGGLAGLASAVLFFSFSLKRRTYPIPRANSSHIPPK
jgi:predicted MFS family arabinose efflux permease